MYVVYSSEMSIRYRSVPVPRLMDILGWLRIAPWVAEIIEVDLPDCDYLLCVGCQCVQCEKEACAIDSRMQK